MYRPNAWNILLVVAILLLWDGGCTVTTSGGGGGGAEPIDGGGSSGQQPDAGNTDIDLADDGSSGTDTGSDPVAAARAVEGTKAIAQTVMSMVIPRVTFWLSSLTRQGGGGFDCPFGGGASVGPDGSTTFNDCLLAPDFLLRGTTRFVPGEPGTQGGRIEFDNFGGTNQGTEFSMDGFIEEIENLDSLTFRFDFDSTQTGGGYTDTFRYEGEIRVDDDGNMSGRMLSETNDLKSVCNFDGVNVFDLDSNPDILDEICRDIEEPPS